MYWYFKLSQDLSSDNDIVNTVDRAREAFTIPFWKLQQTDTFTCSGRDYQICLYMALW